MAVTILVDVPDEETKEDAAHTFHHAGWTMPDRDYKFVELHSVSEHEAVKGAKRMPRKGD